MNKKATDLLVRINYKIRREGAKAQAGRGLGEDLRVKLGWHPAKSRIQPWPRTTGGSHLQQKICDLCGLVLAGLITSSIIAGAQDNTLGDAIETEGINWVAQSGEFLG
jgi:hypothetical protein